MKTPLKLSRHEAFNMHHKALTTRNNAIVQELFPQQLQGKTKSIAIRIIIAFHLSLSTRLAIVTKWKQKLRMIKINDNFLPLSCFHSWRQNQPLKILEVITSITY
jgi:hypothetical protein